MNTTVLASGMGFPPLPGARGIYHFSTTDVNFFIGAAFNQKAKRLQKVIVLAWSAAILESC